MTGKARIGDTQEPLEQCCALVIAAGLATGHADTVVDLMREVLAQVDELRDELKGARETIVLLVEIAK